MKVNVIYYISLVDFSNSAPLTVYNLNKVGKWPHNSSISSVQQTGLADGIDIMTDRMPNNAIFPDPLYVMGPKIHQRGEVDNEFAIQGATCGLTQLPVEFLTSLGRQYLSDYPDVQYKGRSIRAEKFFRRMINRLQHPQFTNARRRRIGGADVPCELLEALDIADSAQSLVHALRDVIDNKLSGAKIYGFWKERVDALISLID